MTSRREVNRAGNTVRHLNCISVSFSEGGGHGTDRDNRRRDLLKFSRIIYIERCISERYRDLGVYCLHESHRARTKSSGEEGGGAAR